MIGLMHAALFWACLSSIILWVLFVYAHLFVDYVRTFIVCTTGYMFFMNIYECLLYFVKVPFQFEICCFHLHSHILIST